MDTAAPGRVTGTFVRRLLGLAVLVVAGLTLFAVACGGDGGGGDKADVEAAIQAAADAWNAKEVDGFLAAFTDQNIQAEFDATREEAQQFLAEEAGQPPITLGELSNTAVSGDTATTEALEFAFGRLLDPQRISLVKEDDAWKIDGIEHLTAEIPNGVTAVDLALTEYKFNFDEAAITDGNIAFNVSNIGGEQHVVDLSKIPEDLDIEQALQSPEEPEGIEFVGNIEPLDPGGETTMVFTEALAPGRYVIICWVEAADGEPHFAKGMWAEFTVE